VVEPTPITDAKKAKKRKPRRWEDPTSWMHIHTWIEAENGGLKPSSLLNLKNMIEFHPDLAGTFTYNEFSAEIIITKPLPGDCRKDFPRPIRDDDEANLAAWLNGVGLSPSIVNTGQMLRAVALANSFDPMKRWLSSLEWDGVERVDFWLTRYAGAENEEYTRTVGRKFLISAVARAMQPGCKCDTMPVFEGPQGLKKSSLVRVLCGAEHFSDQIGDISNKDSQGAIQGKWIVEVPEMDKFTKKESDTVKDFLSRQEDWYRPPFGRNFIKRPRRCVFVGTINPMVGSGYLKDTTGARRFWPVACTQIDLAGVSRDREQLWGEAYHMWASGQAWWIDEDEAHIVLDEQEDRIDSDVWEPRVKTWLASQYGDFTVSQALVDAVGVELSRQDHRAKLRMSGILTSLRCVRDRQMVGGKRNRTYRRPD
jgi:predicted P-loop ATPase